MAESKCSACNTNNFSYKQIKANEPVPTSSSAFIVYCYECGNNVGCFGRTR
ncbi:MAG: hypothetical protein ACFFBD_25810 [Candidatus Hodarchaeota archaeon]